MQIISISLLVISGLLTLSICIYARPIGHRLKVLDIPNRNGRKLHHKVTPMVGGIAIVIPVSFVIVYGAISNSFQLFAAIGLLVWGPFILGLLDDRKHVRPTYRLLISAGLIVVALYLVPEFRVTELQFSALPHGLPLGIWSIAFTALCLVGLQNAVNMADGKDGLVIGLSVIWVSVLIIYAPTHLVVYLMAVVVSLLVVLGFNMAGKLFLGDAGSYALSSGTGTLAIYIYNTGDTTIPAEIILLLFLIPVLDCLRIIALRLYEGRSPFDGDRKHFHHILYRFLPRFGALFSYLVLVFAPSVIAMEFPDMTYVMIFFVVAIYTVIVGGNFMVRYFERSTGKRIGDR